ncbi:CHAP domain-containing protein [Nonomuraea sp. NPDC052634]|uniref:CHAP domain-containing protein n=1 Tax=Nonomuraea sp. NPDC052634 TaxID=3155813 RepID=UPI0034181932
MKTVRQELGYKEKKGQYTKFGQWYADRVQDSQYRDAPWCDMFLAWAANKAGVSEYVGEFAWTPSHAAWFIQKGAWSKKPEPGALVFFDWRGGKSYKGIDHVGIVERVAGKKIHTIEANVDRVWLKRKVRETDKVVGYGIPRLVKANADLNEIRSTEQPFISPPRSQTGQGSPLDFLGTPVALLAAMVLTTIVLSLRLTRRRGAHRRLSWPWFARSRSSSAQDVRRVPTPRNPFAGESPPERRPAGSRPRTAAPPQTFQTSQIVRPAQTARPKPQSAPQAARPARTRVAAGSVPEPASRRRRPYERS